MYGKKLCSLLTCSQGDLLHLSRRFEGIEFLGTEAPDFDTRAAEGSGQETGVIRNTHRREAVCVCGCARKLGKKEGGRVRKLDDMLLKKSC